MDLSTLSGIGLAITTAREIGKTALAIRDFNEFATTISHLNEQLLKAQDGLFKVSIDAHALQSKLTDTEKKYLKLEQATNERARYSLFEISTGIFVYRLKNLVELEAINAEMRSEPTHYVCQRCLDQGTKAVLMRHTFDNFIAHICPCCKTEFMERAHDEMAMQPFRSR